jgi:hypothetical protein
MRIKDYPMIYGPTGEALPCTTDDALNSQSRGRPIFSRAQHKR